jgi:hypothetical protein
MKKTKQANNKKAIFANMLSESINDEEGVAVVLN